MKNISIKLKITLWLTALVAVLNVVLVGMALFVSNSVATDEAMKRLESTARANIQYVEPEGKTASISEDFVYYQNGVTALVYSKSGSLLAGQVPVNFKTTEEFNNGLIREVDIGDSKFLVLDLWVPSDWDNGVWIRTITDASDNYQFVQYLLRISAITLPIFTLLAALGSFFVIKGSFKPLDKITATAEAINEAKDLSGRIGLPKANNEFARLAENFDSMFERLERSFEAEKRFTADASHELRTPIAIIKSACDYSLKYDETSVEFKDSVSVIQRQADKMSQLVNQLLSMTRMEQGTEKANFEQIDLSDFINGMYCEQQWGRKGVFLTAEEGITVKADRELLSRLVINLAENAFKYGGDYCIVKISVTADGDTAVLAVKDNGKGIAKEHQGKIWQRFYQVDSSRTDSKDSGTGLGLSIVQQIARIHGGYMTLESETGKGSTFALHLPMVK